MTQEAFSCLVLGFLLGALWLLEGALSAQMGNFHLNYLYTYLHTGWGLILVVKIQVGR